MASRDEDSSSFAVRFLSAPGCDFWVRSRDEISLRGVRVSSRGAGRANR